MSMHTDNRHSKIHARGMKGFTLIELLVVISIIALLLSIIVPSLSMAKEVAKRTICASNLKQLSTGILAYATDKNGKLPQSRYQTAKPYNNTTGTGYPVSLTYSMLELDSTNLVQLAAMSPKKRITFAWGLGLLFTNDYVEEGEAFYCPGVHAELSSYFGYGAYANGGDDFPFKNENMIPSDRNVRSSYSYIPQASHKKVPVSSESGSGYFLDTAQVVTELNSNNLLACDVFLVPEQLPHKKGKAAIGVNVLKGDGSVAFSKMDINNPDVKRLVEGRLESKDEYAFRKVIDLLNN